MSSIIDGYNYDIFISYRQKDNKHDGWVSEFVDHLKGELESTFKEDVSVYFDENPEDRLQETHDVEKSLEGKLKCLIFIPIISQTYCDPRSYAWQSEFLPFLSMAGEDRFGKDVKLRNGNVASRILPIRIHDLEHEDIKLYEKETGSVLRAIDFVFKTATGVSRPLLSNEDHPNDNINKTYYRDQISKAGNAIKEIILAMRAEPGMIVGRNFQEIEPSKGTKYEEKRIEPEKAFKAGKIRLLATVVVMMLVLIAGIIAYPKIFKTDTLENLRSIGKISVAVMPFQNMTNDTSWNVWQNGIQDILVTYLSDSPEELKIRQTESVKDLIQSKGLTNYASLTPSVASDISQKLDASVFIYGSIIKAGSRIRINAQLIDSKTRETFKSFEIDGPSEQRMIFQIADSLKNMVGDYLIISVLKKELPVGFRSFESTNSPEAFRYYIYGDNALRKKNWSLAIELFSQAVAIDSNFTLAALNLAWSYYSIYMEDEAKKWCQMLYEKREQMPYELRLRTNYLYAALYETPYKELEIVRQLQEIDDQSPSTYYHLGIIYCLVEQWDNAIPEFETSLEEYKKMGIKPLWAYNYIFLGYAYHMTGQYTKEKKLYRRADKDFPGDIDLLSSKSILYFAEEDTISANKCIGELISLLKGQPSSEITIATDLAYIYTEAGIWEKAETYYRKALSIEPENPEILNNLAWFLIDNNRNLNEGLELVNKALELNPDDWRLIDTKGWGLYKRGKYKEALDLLQEAWTLKPVYDHEVYLHLEAAKKAVAE
jgi:tetratricopeptide (TPR) repeat protein